MGLTFVMLALLVGCYVLCGALVLFAEGVIRPRILEPAETGDLTQSDSLPDKGSQQVRASHHGC